MKIGLIADHLSIERGTGIARYARELADHLIQEGFSVDIISVPHITSPAGEFLTHITRLPIEILRRARACDVLHATSPVTALPFPLIRKPKVTTFHDLISLLHPGIGTRLHVHLLLPWLFRLAARNSDIVITPSAQTKDEVAEHLGIERERIRVIPYGISPIFKPIDSRGHEGTNIGYVGALLPRKRVDFLIRAFHSLMETHPELNPRLRIYGSRTHEYHNLLRLAENRGISGRVEFCGFATDRDLPLMYNSMDVLVLPSDWEGFGFPIIEAQRCGVPVVIRADARISPEIGQCCIKVDSEEEMSNKIVQILTDTTMRDRIVRDGLEYTRRFTWKRAVEETVNVYEEAVMSRTPRTLS